MRTKEKQRRVWASVPAIEAYISLQAPCYGKDIGLIELWVQAKEEAEAKPNSAAEISYNSLSAQGRAALSTYTWWARENWSQRALAIVPTKNPYNKKETEEGWDRIPANN